MATIMCSECNNKEEKWSTDYTCARCGGTKLVVGFPVPMKKVKLCGNDHHLKDNKCIQNCGSSDIIEKLEKQIPEPKCPLYKCTNHNCGNVIDIRKISTLKCECGGTQVKQLFTEGRVPVEFPAV